MTFSETRCMSSARYGGAWPDKDEKTKHASLYSTRLWTGSQCNCRKTGEIWSRRSAPVRSRAYSGVLHGLSSDKIVGHTIEQWVAVIQATGYERLDKCTWRHKSNIWKLLLSDAHLIQITEFLTQKNRARYTTHQAVQLVIGHKIGFLQFYLKNKIGRFRSTKIMQCKIPQLVKTSKITENICQISLDTWLSKIQTELRYRVTSRWTQQTNKGHFVRDLPDQLTG